MSKFNWKIEPTNPGARATVGHQNTILNSNGHLLDTKAFASKQIQPSQPATIGANLSYSYTPPGNNDHRVDAGVFAAKQVQPSAPATVGANVGYTHTPSGSNLNVGAQRTPGYGTDVSATATANIWNSGASRLDAVGSYERHYGGPAKTQKPNYGGGLKFRHNF